MIRARGNGHHVAPPVGTARLAPLIASPRGDRPVAAQRQAVIRARGKGHHVAQPGGEGRLARAIISPRDDRPVAAQRQTEINARGNGHHVAQPGGDRRLAPKTVSPRDDRAVAAQRQIVIIPTGKCHHVAQAGGDSRLARAILSPPDDCPVTAQCQAVILACGNGHHVTQAGGDVFLAFVTLPPHDDRAVAAQRHVVIISPGKGTGPGERAQLGVGGIGRHGHRRRSVQRDGGQWCSRRIRRIRAKVGGDTAVGRHATIGARVGGGAVAPVEEVVSGGGHGCDGGAAGVVVDRLGRGAGDGAVRACRVGYAESVDREIRGDALGGGDVGIGARIGGGAVAPIHEVVAGGCEGGDGGAAGAVVDRLRGGADERAVGAGGVGQGEGVDREGRGHALVRGDVNVGARRRQHAIAPVHKRVAGGRHGGDGAAAGAVVDGLRRGAGERAVGARGVSQGVGVDREVGGDAHIPHHVGIGQ